MVSLRDRMHFERIAEGEAQLRSDSIVSSSQRSAGENIALGLSLGEFAAEFGGNFSRPEKVAPAALRRVP